MAVTASNGNKYDDGDVDVGTGDEHDDGAIVSSLSNRSLDG